APQSAGHRAPPLSRGRRGTAKLLERAGFLEGNVGRPRMSVVVPKCHANITRHANDHITILSKILSFDELIRHTVSKRRRIRSSVCDRVGAADEEAARSY